MQIKRAARDRWPLGLMSSSRKAPVHIGFTPSKVDECVFYRGTTIFLVYVDDCIIIDPKANKIDQVISDLRKEKFDIDEVGNLSDYLGVKIENLDDQSYQAFSTPLD